MDYTRKYILRQSLECRREFTQNVLSKFFSPYHIYCWNNKCKFSSFKGNDLKEFVLNSTSIASFIKEKLEKTTENESLICSLEVLKSIFNFVRISKINVSNETYIEKLSMFENDVRSLFKHGKVMFLLHENVSFYFHSLRFYFLQIARHKFDNHWPGLGIFTM